MKKFIGILPTLQLNDAPVARQLAVHPSRSLGMTPQTCLMGYIIR